MGYHQTTPHAGLPQWASDDKPERADFNEAFEKVDKLVGKLADELSKLADQLDQKADKDGNLQQNLYAEKARNYAQLKMKDMDLNDLTGVGVYTLDGTCPNAPLSNTFFAVYVSQVNSDLRYVQQLAISLHGLMFLRICQNAVWEPWKKIQFQA